MKLESKRSKWIVGVLALIVLIAIFGGNNSEEVTEVQSEPKADASAKEKTEEKAQPVAVKAEEKPKLSPLTKSEVLDKYALGDASDQYEDGRFLFVGQRSEYADYHTLAPTDLFEDASVIFQDGELVAVKLWLSEGADVGKAYEAFGIADAAEKARRQNEFTHVYEYAIKPIFWAQNIERYPNEYE